MRALAKPSRQTLTPGQSVSLFCHARTKGCDVWCCCLCQLPEAGDGLSVTKVIKPSAAATTGQGPRARGPKVAAVSDGGQDGADSLKGRLVRQKDYSGRGFGHMMGWGPYGGIRMILFWILLIASLLFLLRRFSAGLQGPQSKDAAPHSAALEILQERYAKDEISKDEYEARKRTQMP